MIGYRLSELATPLQGRLLGGDAAFTRVSTDTRTLQPGDLFVPLQGPRFDGHDHLDAARLRGAVGALVSRGGAHPLPALKVADTLAGLGALARLWRQASPAPVVAVTGSNGKTTVKEMLASILGLQAEVLSTRGNLNNAVGLPLTLLRLQQQRWAVVEMGASAPGEIGYLSDIARPDLALLINAGRAHLEGFGSVEGVARAKAEILRGLKAGGFFVYNADDPFAPLWAELAAGWPTRTFGIRARADVVSPEPALELRWEGDGFVSRFPVRCASGEMEIELSLAGQHNRLNALAAIAAAEALGVGPETIRAGLKRLRPVAGRLRPLRGRGGARLIDDTYNANPDSVMAAIAVLTQLPGRPLLVLGELAEMGVEGPRFYREIGTRAREAGVRALYALGGAGAAVAGFGPGGRGFDRLEPLLEALTGSLEKDDLVLVKGSRSAGMERVVGLLADPGEN